MQQIRLGDKVRDKITGMTGIAVARTEWMYGCVRFSIQPQDLKDGRPVDSCAVDEPQLELVERAVIANDPAPTPITETGGTHGPRPDVARPAPVPRP